MKLICLYLWTVSFSTNHCRNDWMQSEKVLASTREQAVKTAILVGNQYSDCSLTGPPAFLEDEVVKIERGDSYCYVRP